ncbi:MULTISPECIES: TetR/AcrR family transcriptional regulator [Streptomyces]|uniref:TetR/AcrR family transcriptional regulator n=1 Tax=Streptomyces morookaense TaxID=1970 RepID=A0A7Y7E7C2_STRMO|nr:MULTISPECIES: TetR/AcrR family transcriptional regulator [Streptomyces]MCC2273976.1 TetR/AcrR family transcriptional regulator [Streptomyces sp. ET3-23]NVK78828.1 TetR/AcrR family transcriptional regulator [Streptomyces morookaense]GHF35114.1 TetR family transcriptional regulator [Streptomyces morookaense]
MAMTPRQAATAARKEQITRAAIALLAEQGYQATTFEAICKRAGLSSKRLITYHFSGKDELFAAVADQVVADSESFMRPSLAAATGPRDLLAAVIRANVAFIADHVPEVRALQQILLNGGTGAYERHHTEGLKRLARLFADGQRAGVFRSFDPQVMAASLRASIDSTAPLLSAGHDPDTCANELADLYDRAVRPE